MGDGTAVSLHLCFDWRVKKKKCGKEGNTTTKWFSYFPLLNVIESYCMLQLTTRTYFLSFFFLTPIFYLLNFSYYEINNLHLKMF